jgi:tetratricopeptide (TPR) repeat protein
MSKKRNKKAKNKRVANSASGQKRRSSVLGNANSRLLQQAIQSHQSGNIQLASNLYQQILASDPNNADANNLLGVIAHQTGDDQTAVQLITRAINSNPKMLSAYNNLGVALTKLGRQEEAIESYKNALRIKQNYPEAHNNCGNALSDLGRQDEAVACYRKAIALKPNYVDAHSNLGNALRILGEYKQAAASYRNAIKISPSFIEAHRGLGMAYASLRQWDGAIDSFRKVIKQNPRHAEAQNNLGNALKAKGEIMESMACYRSAISINPSYAEAYKNLGVALEHSGNLPEAEENYRKAIAIKSDFAEVYRHLSSVVRHTENDSDIQAMEHLYQDNSISDEQRMHLCFALGKAYEDLKEYTRSFELFSEANQIKRKTFDYSTRESERFFADIKHTFSPVFFSQHMNMGVSDETPIFILGMPRSGTTLVEHIIASHPQVYGAGELGYMGELVKRLCPKGERFPYITSDLDAASIAGVGDDYLKKLREHSSEDKFVTDKMPHNFLYVGLIKIALPNAKIIHCCREPLDTCLSIYKNYFADAHKYAYDLRELGEYYRLYADLMEYWRGTLPGVIYDIYYEELIADQEGQTRQLLEYCNLPWDEACLGFYRSGRNVQTASSAQVRQPIYSSSVKLSELYGDQLAVLKESLS